MSDRNYGYDDEDDSFDRPSGGGRVGPSSIAYESRKRPRRRLITTLVVLVAVGGFVGIVWHAYNQGRSGEDGVVPLITAEDGPTKVRPDQPGGMDVPNQDKLIYDRLAPGSQMATPQIERLLPPAEAPVARPQAAAPPPATGQEQPQLDERQVTTAPPPQSPAPAQPQAPSQAAPAPAEPPIPVAPPAPSQAAQAPVQARPAPASTPAPAQTASIPPGSSRVQLGAVRSADAAKKEWTRLQNANKDLLGGLTVNVVTANLGERGTFYRIQAGPVSDAADLCAKLKARNVGCIVVH
jgi:hypothetical protein